MTVERFEARTGPFSLVVMHNEEFHPLVGWVPCIAVSIHNDDSKTGMAFTFDGPGFERFADAVAAFAADGPKGVPDVEFQPNWAAVLEKSRGPDYKRQALARGEARSEFCDPPSGSKGGVKS